MAELEGKFLGIDVTSKPMFFFWCFNGHDLFGGWFFSQFDPCQSAMHLADVFDYRLRFLKPCLEFMRFYFSCF